MHGDIRYWYCSQWLDVSQWNVVPPTSCSARLQRGCSARLQRGSTQASVSFQRQGLCTLLSLCAPAAVAMTLDAACSRLPLELRLATLVTRLEVRDEARFVAQVEPNLKYRSTASRRAKARESSLKPRWRRGVRWIRHCTHSRCSLCAFAHHQPASW